MLNQSASGRTWRAFYVFKYDLFLKMIYCSAGGEIFQWYTYVGGYYGYFIITKSLIKIHNHPFITIDELWRNSILLESKVHIMTEYSRSPASPLISGSSSSDVVPLICVLWIDSWFDELDFGDESEFDVIPFWIP